MLENREESRTGATVLGGDPGVFGSVVAVSRQRQLLTLLGLKEGVGQRDGVHPRHPGVVVELRVDVEEDGHVDLLVRVQALLLEAETLQRGARC